MPVQSKVATQSSIDVVGQLLMGTNRRKVVSATILLIVAFLIHIRNKKPDVDTLKTSRVDRERSKKVHNLLARVEKDTLMPFFGAGSKN